MLPAPGSKPAPARPIRGPRIYLRILRSPGVPVPAIGAALASVPIGMLGLSLLLLVQARIGSFAAAGVIVAVLGLGTGVGMIVQGRLLDRIGPRRVLEVSSALRGVASVAFVVVIGLRPTLAALVALAFVIGVSEPQVSSALRAMWPVLLGRELLPAANALSSVLFELPVVAGPLLLALVIAVLPVEVAVLAAAAFAVAGAWMFARSAAARRWRKPAPVPVRGLLGPLAIRGVRVIVLAMAAPSAALGIVQVTSAAAVTATGAAEQAGVLYAVLAGGSLLGTVLYGSWAPPVAARWQLPALLFGQAGSLVVAAVAPGVGFPGSVCVRFRVA